MRNNYIFDIRNDKNEFRTTASFDILNTHFIVNNLKIDTGCGFTTFPARKLGTFSDSELLKFKESDIKSNTGRHLSYGVETGGTKHVKPITQEEWMQCCAVSFDKKIDNFYIDGIKINTNYIRINYNRKGNLLLGMDILSKMDIHIGKDIHTNETIFLACPYDKINDNYLLALESHFGIGTDVNSALTRKLL